MRASLAVAVLLAASLAAADEAKPRPCDPVTGEITFKEPARRRVGVRNAEGRIWTFTVDAVAMPRWNEDFQVSARVTVTCKDAGDERRPIATSIKAAPAQPDKKP